MQRMPTVLHLRSSTGLYGAEQVLLSLLPGLTAHGFRPVLATLTPESQTQPALVREAHARGLEAYALACAGRISLSTVAAVRRLATTVGADLIHVHDYKSAVHGWLAARARLPLVTTVHGQCSGDLRVLIYNWIERRMARESAQVCAVSPDLQQQLIQSGVAAHRTHAVPNGIDTTRFQPADRTAVRRALGLPPDARVVGTAIRLAAEKRPLALLQALAQARSLGLPSCQLLIAGDGPLRSRVEAEISALGLRDQVRLLGVRSDMAALYPALDAFVLISEREGMPMSLLEAMACNIPPIVTPVGAIPEVLAELPSTLVRTVALADTTGLAHSLTGFSPPEAQRPLLRARVLERYASSHLARHHARIYQQALALPAALETPPEVQKA